MLHRPSKAVMAKIVEAIGALVAALTQPFVSHDVGYAQVVPGQKSRKVRNHMLKSPFKSVIARAATFALVLALGIAFVTVGLAPSASAQTADEPPCKVVDKETGAVECTYEENGTDAVADFSALDPEGEGIDWSVEGTDAGKFEIDGGVLSFKDSPNYEMPGDLAHDANDDDDTDDPGEAAGGNTYEVMVRATEMLAENQDPPALPSMLPVTVIVTDVDEAGSISLSRVQPQAGQPLQATLSDADVGDGTPAAVPPSGLQWVWSVPKVSRPVLENNAHWTPATAESATVNQDLTSTFIPDADTTDTDDGANNGKFLRVMVEYTDQHGAEKVAYKMSYREVRAEPVGNNPPTFDATADFNAKVAENAGVGTAVGTPVSATDPNDGDILSYVLSGDDEEDFKINIMTGQITVGTKLDHEAGSDSGNGVYQLTVTAYDPSNGTPAPTATLTVTVTDVNEAPTVDDSATDEMMSVDEHYPVTDDPDADPPVVSVPIGTYSATDQDDGDETKLSLGGEDAAAFELGEPIADGQTNEGDRELRFKKSPNFEKPADANQDNAYKVTVVATDKKGLTGTKALTIVVDNIDEVGTVSLSKIQPAIGQPITASLSDDDGRTSDVKWQWYSSLTDAGVFADAIDGATSSTYTPKGEVPDDLTTLGIDESDPGDEGMFLQARVTYRDFQSIDDVEGTAKEEGRRGVDDLDTQSGTDEEGVGEALVYKTSQHAVRAVPDVNNAPEFDSATMTREVNEGETGNVPDPVTADDPDEDSLNYSISGGADMDSFDIVLGSGQIQVGDGTKLDAEGAQTSYEVEVTAADPFGKTDATMVTIMVINVNEEPDFMPEDPEDQEYDENGTGPVATFTAIDPEGAGIDWSVEGTDAADFSIDANGVLTFKNPPDFEDPSDRADAAATPAIEADDNDYQVTVRASEMRAADAEGETKSSTQDITVSVKNVEEPGSISLDRVQPQSGVGLTATLSDDDGPSGDAPNIDVTWEWSVPKVSRPVLENNSHWTPAATSGHTSAEYEPLALNETKVLRVKASYNDGEGDEKTAFMVSYYGVREAPAGNDAPVFSDTADYTRSIAESAPVGTRVGAPVTATDANAGDAGKLTYLLSATDGTVNAGKFKIDKMTGQIMVASELDHEEMLVVGDGNAYTVTITVWDPSNNDETSPFDQGTAETEDVTITATDVNEAPTVTGTTETMMVEENHIVVNDPDADPPVEGAIVLGTYTKSDPDDGDETRFTLSGDDASEFVLGEPDNDGARELRFKASPNYESPTSATKANAYKVTVVATDKKGLTGTKELTIAVENIDEKGSVKLSTIQPGVGQEITATLSDDDGGETGAKWQWSSAGTENGTFLPIEDATSRSYTPKKTVPDNPLTEDVDEGFTGDEGMFLRVTVTYRDAQSDDDNEDTPYEEGRRGIQDPGTAGTEQDPDAVGEAPVMKTSQNAVREVPEVNRPPMFESASMMREVEENTRAGFAIGGDPITADDPDGDTLTYSRSGGADMASFTIDSTTGQLKVGEGTDLDFEGTQTTYEVEVKAEDPFGKSDTTLVTITVTNVNEAPDLMLVPDEPVVVVVPEAVVVMGDSAVDYEENGTEAVATYMSSVADVTWSLSGDDADDFTISGGVLEFTSPPDWESPLDANTDNDYMVTVAATDGTTTGTVSVTVTVTDVLDEETPTNGAFDPLSYDADGSGTIEKSEMISAINDYLFGTGTIEKSEMIQVINLYLFRS